MDSNHFDIVIRTCASRAPRRVILGLLAGSAFTVAPDGTSVGKGKKKVTLCLNGQTMKVKKGRKGGLLKQGAALGACAPSSPPPPPPAITCGNGTRICGTSCIPSNQCCTSVDCPADRSCQDGICVCPAGIITCSGVCCIAPATLPVIGISCETQGTPVCICTVRGSDVCPPGCPANLTLDLPCAAATSEFIADYCVDMGCD